MPSVASEHHKIAPHHAAQARPAPAPADDRGQDTSFAALLEADAAEPKSRRSPADVTPSDRKRAPQKSERRDEPAVSAKGEPAPEDSKTVVKDGKDATAADGEREPHEPTIAGGIVEADADIDAAPEQTDPVADIPAPAVAAPAPPVPAPDPKAPVPAAASALTAPTDPALPADADGARNGAPPAPVLSADTVPEENATDPGKKADAKGAAPNLASPSAPAETEPSTVGKDAKDQNESQPGNERAPTAEARTARPPTPEQDPRPDPAARPSDPGKASLDLPLQPATSPHVATTGPHVTTSSSAAPQAAAAVPVARLAVEIAVQARAGRNRFEIRLDPPELGRIDVRLDFDRHGHVTSRLIVERAETLDLLRRDVQQLERALEQAGLKTSDNGLQFSLRGQSHQGSDQERSGPAAQLVIPEGEIPTGESLQHNYGRLLGLGRGIDIRI